MAAGRLSEPLPAAQPAANALAHADWSAAWFDAVANEARSIVWRSPLEAVALLNARAAARGLATAAGVPLRFADASQPQAPVAAYELQVAAGTVPTRLHGDGFVHDALAALVWLRFARTKAALNALQVAELARSGAGPRRGALRDAVTLFDENALLLAVGRDGAADGVLAALRERDWQAAFVQSRGLWHQAIVPVAFGHALMQKLLVPFKAITAHAWVVPVDQHWFQQPRGQRYEQLDRYVADRIGQWLADRALRMPVPVLGIPGWWPANAQPDFYDDAAVFRRPGNAPGAPRDARSDRGGAAADASGADVAANLIGGTVSS